MTSRDRQNVILRALCDAEFRRTADLGGVDSAGLSRFGAFLVRHYYHERVVHYFKYSRALGYDPMPVIEGDVIGHIIKTAVLGSRRTAEEVASAITDYLRDCGGKTILYWNDLVRYQAAHFIADARIGVPEQPDILEFEWDLPKVLPVLLQKPDPVPMPPRERTTLQFLRRESGEVVVLKHR